MYIKSIDEAVRKAISEAAHIFKDGDVERIVKEACEKANQRISIKMPVTISTPNEPWIYISSTLTADRNFELFVIVNLTDVAEDYLRDTQFEATRKIIAGRGSTIDNNMLNIVIGLFTHRAQSITNGGRRIKANGHYRKFHIDALGTTR